MRNSPSGAVNSRFTYTFPAGTVVPPGGSAGTTVPIQAAEGDNIIANWDVDSFGPRGILQVEAQIATPILGVVNIWNWSAAPINTPVDLTVIVQVIPQQ